MSIGQQGYKSFNHDCALSFFCYQIYPQDFLNQSLVDWATVAEPYVNVTFDGNNSTIYPYSLFDVELGRDQRTDFLLISLCSSNFLSIRQS